LKLEIKNVSKNFGSVKALNNVSIEFETSHIYALLGRNGAGKSTLMNIISKRIFQSEGEVLLDGEEIKSDELLSNIYLMSETSFYGNRKVENVFKIAKIFDEGFDGDFALKLSKDFKLNTSQKITKLSTGYLTIFKVIMAICSSCKFVMFDEPILGLDANHRNVFYKLLLSSFAQKQGDVCYIISTHLIDEVSSLIEKAIIIKEGNILIQGDVDELLRSSLSVKGLKTEVERATKNCRVLGTDTVGSEMTSIVIGDVEPDDSVEVSSVDLQSLFIELTNEGGF
jgi:ABC-2 type transport system ATP-binding protein